MNTPVVTAFQTGTHRTENSLGLGLLRQPGTVLFGPGQRRQLPAWSPRSGSGCS